MSQRAVPAGTLGLTMPDWSIGRHEEQPLVLTSSQKILFITETETRTTTAPNRETGVNYINNRLEKLAKQRMTHKCRRKLKKKISLSPNSVVLYLRWLFVIYCSFLYIFLKKKIPLHESERLKPLLIYFFFLIVERYANN